MDYILNNNKPKSNPIFSLQIVVLAVIFLIYIWKHNLFVVSGVGLHVAIVCVILWAADFVGNYLKHRNKIVFLLLTFSLLGVVLSNLFAIMLPELKDIMYIVFRRLFSICFVIFLYKSYALPIGGNKTKNLE